MYYSLNKALKLKDTFFNFIEDKEIKKEFNKEASKYNLKNQIDFIEWFLFEKHFEEGQNLLDIFLLQNFPTEDNELMMSWKKYVLSIFKVKKEQDGVYTLLNMINNEKYLVETSSINIKLNIGDYVISRLLPFFERYIFSSNPYLLKTNSNDDIYRIVALFEVEFPNFAFIDNKNKMETSYKIQFLEHDDFIEFFGSDEIIVEGKEINSKLQEFYHFRYFQKKDKEQGKTIAKLFREKFGTYPEIPLVEIPDYITSLDEVGIIYDKIEGLNFLPWYGIFKEIFRNEDFKSIPGYKECVLEYLKSTTISTLPFKRVLREFPNNTINVFKDVLDRKRFSIPEDWDKAMLKYKKSILSNQLQPSVISMTERTKALLRTKKIEEYVGLHFSEGFNNFKSISEIFKDFF
ncbi:MAG: hypothetical protein U0457_17565 [Candidatus Sericytochromatia bacterium]